jgi:hypothetical protein
LRAYAIGNGLTISSVITGLVEDFLRVNQGLNLSQTQREPSTDAVFALPVTAGPSEKASGNAVIPGLKRIDEQRKKNDGEKRERD